MHPAIYSRFGQLFRQYVPPGREILEIGATENMPETLLTLFRELSETYHCVGINIHVGPADNLPYRLIQCNGNTMDIFNDESFDAVACNAVLEHDKFFWKTLGEVRRVLKPGGLFYVGVPGFPKQNNFIQRSILNVMHSKSLRSFHLLSRLARWAMLTRLALTSTLMFHGAPHDFYRFSEEAVKEVFLEGLVILHLEHILEPVRIIGIGRKPHRDRG